MSVVGTLLCQRGQDSALRLAAIQMIAVVLMLLVVGLFFNTSLQQTALAAVIAAVTPIIGLSARRRLNQAQKPQWLALALTGVWLLQIPFQLLLPAWAWWGLLLPLAVSVPLLLLPSQSSKQTGVWGYQGPAMVMPVARNRGSRVEPSLDGEVAAEAVAVDWDAPVKSTPIPWGELLSQAITALKRHWKPVAGATAVLLVLLIGRLALTTSQVEQAAQPTHTEQVEPKPEQLDTPPMQAQVALPDSFQLAIYHDMLMISWPGDPVAKGELWSQLTAKGDRSCAEAVFNNGDRFRPIKVEVWPNDIYYAYFSPLDTHSLVFDVAMRGSFELCGYDFSLRGSMKPLKADPAFALYTSK